MHPAAARLAEYLHDGSDGPMADEVAGWLSASPRFRAFADAHRDKIRKKLRGATDADSRLDVRAELCVAHLLLADRRMELAFEASGSTRGGPDFGVAYREHPAFNLEVTRMHRAASGAALGRVLLAKLRQLPPGTPNALLVAVSAPGADIADAVRALRSRRRRERRNRALARRIRRSRRLLPALPQARGRRGVVRGRGRRGARVSVGERSARIAVPGPALRAAVAALRAGAG